MYDTAQDVITEMRMFIERRLRMDDAIAHLAATYILNWMRSHDLTQLNVDDENEIPGYALNEDGEMFEDEEDLDQAIGWLPATAFINTGPLRNQPAVTIETLTALLNGGEQ